MQCVYLKALQIAYAEDLLQAVKDEFGKMFKDRIEDRSVDFGKHFDVKFDELLERAPASFGAAPLRGQHTSARHFRTHWARTRSSKADEGSRKNKPVMRTFSQTKGKDDQSKPKPKSEKAAEDPEPEEPANEAAAPEVLVSRPKSITNRRTACVLIVPLCMCVLRANAGGKCMQLGSLVSAVDGLSLHPTVRAEPADWSR